MPDLRSGAISALTTLAGLPWRLKPGRTKPLLPTDPHLARVVVIKPCCMGDVLMATPTVASLREALPDAHIAFAVSAYSRQAVANNPRLSSIIDVPQDETGTIRYLKLARLIRRGNFGAVLVLDRSPMLNLVPYLAGVPVRAGLDSSGRGLALTHPVPCPSNTARHEVEWYLDVARTLGIHIDERAHLEFYPTPQDKVEANKALSEVAGNEETGYVAIHLGGGNNPGMKLLSKRWQPERWARIADWLAETYECTVLLLGGPGQEDREAANTFKAALFPATRGYVADLVGRLAWGPMSALITDCDMFLGHDTGAMHLATAMGTPVVAVFGPSDPTRFGPWDPSGRSVVVAPQQTHSGAGALREASRSQELYHSSVSTEEVWSAVEKTYRQVLSKRRVPR